MNRYQNLSLQLVQKAHPDWPFAKQLSDAKAQFEAAALDLLVRLNDTFALDGGAPPSYGGLLWCLGWRDKPGPGGVPAPESPTQSPSPPPTAPCLRR